MYTPLDLEFAKIRQSSAITGSLIQAQEELVQQVKQQVLPFSSLLFFIHIYISLSGVELSPQAGKRYDQESYLGSSSV
jgi:hypothetical protein